MIAKSGQPVARLVPYRAKGAARRPGAMRGKIRIKKNFDEPFQKSCWLRSQRSCKSATAPRYLCTSLVAVG